MEAVLVEAEVVDCLVVAPPVVVLVVSALTIASRGSNAKASILEGIVFNEALKGLRTNGRNSEKEMSARSAM